MSSPVFSASEICDRIRQEIGEEQHVPAAVCFDFFDTLISRSVVPEETKKIAANRLADLLSCGLTGEEFYQIRSILEKRLCEKNLAAGHDAEFSLADLAQQIHGRLVRLGSEDSITKGQRFIEQLIEIELSVEKEVQQVNEEIAALLRWCHKKGVTTALISDFYLPGDAFSQLLAHHGFADSVDHLFVSADNLLTKGYSGRLYDIAAQKIGCEPADMIMIGDNPHADGTRARERGLRSYCLEGPEERPATAGADEQTRLFAASADTYDQVLQRNRAPFFPEMGLSLHWFIHQLFITVLADDCPELFFCSKEGEFLQRLFVRYQEQKFGREVIASHYLFVSRKATFICSLRPLERETFERLFIHYRDLSLAEFLQSLNFTEAGAAEICTSLGLDYLTRHYDLKNHPDFISLLQAPLFQESYEQLRNTQKENFLDYLTHFDADLAGHGLNLVDVGWKGSIQNNIFHALGGEIEVNGYYIGLLTPTELSGQNRKRGILFHDVPAHSEYIHVFNNNRSLFEMLLGASHGSADAYYSPSQIGGELSEERRVLIPAGEGQGQVLVALVDLPQERKLYREKIRPLQDVYFKLHGDLTDLSGTGTSGMPPFEWLARHHARMVFKPDKAEVDLFSSLYHLENFGLFEFTDFDHSRPVSVVQRLKNLWALRKNPEAFLETGTWPPIILRRLGLGFLTSVDGQKRFNRIFGPGA